MSTRRLAISAFRLSPEVYDVSMMPFRRLSFGRCCSGDISEFTLKLLLFKISLWTVKKTFLTYMFTNFKIRSSKTLKCYFFLQTYSLCLDVSQKMYEALTVG